MSAAPVIKMGLLYFQDISSTSLCARSGHQQAWRALQGPCHAQLERGGGRALLQRAHIARRVEVGGLPVSCSGVRSSEQCGQAHAVIGACI